MSVAVPNAFGLNEDLWPSPGEPAERSRDSCYEFPRSRQPVKMSYYFDAFNSPGVLSNVEFHVTCDEGPAMSAGPPLPSVCSYQANVQCSCGEPAQPVTTTATTTTAFPVAPPRYPRPTARPKATSKHWGMSSHDANVVAGIIVAFVFVVIGIFVLWLLRTLKRHKRMTNDKLANASAGGKGQPNPLFKAGNVDDVALLTVELEEDFAFTGTDDTAVWRVDPKTGQAIPSPPSSTRNTPFNTPSNSPPRSPFIKRVGRSGPPLHLFRTRTPPPAPGSTPGTGPFDSDTGMRVPAAL